MKGPSKLCFKKWYEDVFMSGVFPICAHMISLNESRWHWLTVRIFELWWCFSIKYVFPWAMYTLLIMTLKNDIEMPYGELYVGWQVIGGIVPVIGFIMFLVPLIGNKSVPSGLFK